MADAHPEDVAGEQRRFATLATHVRAFDYIGARSTQGLLNALRLTTCDNNRQNRVEQIQSEIDHQFTVGST